MKRLLVCGIHLLPFALCVFISTVTYHWANPAFIEASIAYRWWFCSFNHVEGRPSTSSLLQTGELLMNMWVGGGGYLFLCVPHEPTEDPHRNGTMRAR